MPTTSAPGDKVACRQCGSVTLKNLGRIPPANLFAGQKLEPPWDGGSLYLCRKCHLAFRHPIRSDEAYEAMYESAAEDIWVTSTLRPDQRHVLQRIEAIGARAGTGASVLDVGCYDGVLLGALGPGFRRFGVEASAAAAREAQKKGIEILVPRIRDIPSIAAQFDVVCAVDVIEHTSEPRRFVEMLVDRLVPGGMLILSTGTHDVRSWRFAGGRYWYCSFPEHISFISPDWARQIGATLGLEVAESHRFAYGAFEGRSLGRAQRSYYRRVARARLKAWFSGGGVLQVQGQPGLFEDHIIVCLRKGATR